MSGKRGIEQRLKQWILGAGQCPNLLRLLLATAYSLNYTTNEGLGGIEDLHPNSL